MAVKITARKNGPFRVETTEGEVVLLDAEGGLYDLTSKPAFSLCRCGASTKRLPAARAVFAVAEAALGG